MPNLSIAGQGALSYWMPSRVCYPSSATLARRLPISVRAHMEKLQADGWRFYVTESRLGYCHQDKRVITIPLAAYGWSSEQLVYLVAHEIAHAHTQIDAQSHGVEFLANFMALCPQNLWHLEPAYTRLHRTASDTKQFIRANRASEHTAHLQLVPQY